MVCSQAFADKNGLPKEVRPRKAAARAFQAAGLGPDDIDVIELHDCFSR